MSHGLITCTYWPGNVGRGTIMGPADGRAASRQWWKTPAARSPGRGSCLYPASRRCCTGLGCFSTAGRRIRASGGCCRSRGRAVRGHASPHPRQLAPGAQGATAGAAEPPASRWPTSEYRTSGGSLATSPHTPGFCHAAGRLPPRGASSPEPAGAAGAGGIRCSSPPRSSSTPGAGAPGPDRAATSTRRSPACFGSPGWPSTGRRRAASGRRSSGSSASADASGEPSPSRIPGASRQPDPSFGRILDTPPCRQTGGKS